MKIKLNTIESAKEFCDIVSDSQYRNIDIDLTCGRYVIDAKSILGILSMDLTKILTVVFHDDNDERCKEFFNKIKKWKIKEEEEWKKLY